MLLSRVIQTQQIDEFMIETDDLNNLKSQILEQRDTLKERLEQDSIADMSNKTEGDDVDRANQEEHKQLLLNRRQHDITHLRQLNLALARIETGDFGYCEYCGELIGTARLRARPESRYCVDCQHHQEVKHNLTGL